MSPQMTEITEIFGVVEIGKAPADNGDYGDFWGGGD
jgi:hypothetical protein